MNNLWKGIAIAGMWISFAFAVPHLSGYGTVALAILFGLLSFDIAGE